MSTADELLALRDLQVSIAGRSIVTGLDLTVHAGRITALVGESGSGKSMTALSTIGLQPRSAEVRGSARLGAAELVGCSAAEMRRIRSGQIGMIFQEPGQSLSPVMKVSTGFRHVLAVREGIRSRARAETRMRELLSSVGLPDPDRSAASYPHELSGGELQRVVIALALSGDPALLIADEPTTALDVTVQRGILDLLVRIVAERQIGVLLITHDMGVVGEIADEVVVLKDGDVVETGSVRQVLAAPEAPYTQALLAAVPRLAESLERADGGAVPERREGEHPVVRVEGLSVEYHRRGGSHRALDDVGMEIRRGEIHGLVGESGSGKSTWGEGPGRPGPRTGANPRDRGRGPAHARRLAAPGGVRAGGARVPGPRLLAEPAPHRGLEHRGAVAAGRRHLPHRHRPAGEAGAGDRAPARLVREPAPA